MWHWLVHFVLAGLLVLFCIDCLTGLWVRRVYAVAYRLMIWRKGWIIFIDLDNFGQVNKEYGHGIGDRVLRKIGWMIQKMSRGRGFRYGGDEFVILVGGLFSSRKDKTIEMAKKIMEEIEEIGVQLGLKTISLTATLVLAHTEQAAVELLQEGKGKGKSQLIIQLGK